MRNLDAFLLDRVFQPISDWIEHTFERTCFWVAQQVYGASCVLMLIGQAIKLSTEPFMAFEAAISAVNISAALIGLNLTIFTIPKLETKVRRLVHSGYVNPGRKALYSSRIGILLLCALLPSYPTLLVLSGLQPDFYSIVGPICSVLAAIGTYFMSCSPPPPARQRDEAQSALTQMS